MPSSAYSEVFAKFPPLESEAIARRDRNIDSGPRPDETICFFHAECLNIRRMRRTNPPAKAKHRETQVPVFIEKDEDGFYVVECPLFEGCYSQGKTVDEALRNIREVINLIVEEGKSRQILKAYHPREVSLHTITL